MKEKTPEQKAKQAEYQRRWIEKNRDKRNEYMREYRKKHPELVKTNNMKYADYQAKCHKDHALRTAETQLRYWTKKVQQLREAQE